MAEIYDVNTTEKCCILAIREYLPQQFQATAWTDLRIGFFLSLTQETDDDDPSALAEEIGTPPRPFLGTADRYQIGVTDGATGTTFIGFTNRGLGRELTAGTSKLVSSDLGIGTTNDDYWRVANEVSENWTLQMVDGTSRRAVSGDGSQVHFPQDNIGTTGPAGYATLLAIRLQRDNAGARRKIISVSTKRDLVNHTANIVYTDTPSATLLETNLQAFPTSVQTLGPVEMSQEPTHIFVYWPFVQSRLRIHAIGVLKYG